MKPAEADPKGLIRESYRIDGITAAECRSIFVDWALSLPVGELVPAALDLLIAQYAIAHPDHPMSRVLAEGLAPAETARRKGGRAGRIGAP
ncbi:MAG: hypothetical protein U1D06_15575, partial [Paracoccaceae bacterium]|nr:hypothetical protein [Paracoccaceae bacterium]